MDDSCEDTECTVEVDDTNRLATLIPSGCGDTAIIWVDDMFFLDGRAAEIQWKAPGDTCEQALDAEAIRRLLNGATPTAGRLLDAVVADVAWVCRNRGVGLYLTTFPAFSVTWEAATQDFLEILVLLDVHCILREVVERPEAVNEYGFWFCVAVMQERQISAQEVRFLSHFSGQIDDLVGSRPDLFPPPKDQYGLPFGAARRPKIDQWIVARRLHADETVRMTLTFYCNPPGPEEVWDHDQLQSGGVQVEAVTEWLGAHMQHASDYDSDVAKALLLAGPEDDGLREIADGKCFRAVLRTLGLPLRVPAGSKLYLPCMPGLAFLLSLRSLWWAMSNEDGHQPPLRMRAELGRGGKDCRICLELDAPDNVAALKNRFEEALQLGAKLDGVHRVTRNLLAIRYARTRVSELAQPMQNPSLFQAITRIRSLEEVVTVDFSPGERQVYLTWQVP
jgi:hypothetical protein